MFDISEFTRWDEIERYEVAIFSRLPTMGYMFEGILENKQIMEKKHLVSSNVSNRRSMANAMEEIASEKAKELVKHGYELHIIKTTIKSQVMV